MQEACDKLNANCIAVERRLKYRNEWTIDNLTLGKSGCYRKKTKSGEIWITCKSCYYKICCLEFVKNIYEGAKLRKLYYNCCPIYDKMSPKSGLLDIHLVSKEKYYELVKKYGYIKILKYELYLASRPIDAM